MKSNSIRSFLAGVVIASSILTSSAQQVPLDTPGKGNLDNTADGLYGGRFPFLRFRKPEAKPAPRAEAPKDVCYDTKSGPIYMTKTMPAEANLGQEFVSEIKLVALECAANVVVTDILPASVEYVRSEPAATVQGKTLTWRFAEMDENGSATIRIWMKPIAEGVIKNCASVTSHPRVCAQTFVGKAVLAITKTGPATAMLGADIAYTVRVTNTGSSIARNVVVTDDIPEGLAHASGQRTLTFNVGDLAPGQSREIPVPVKTTQRGEFCNKATASSSNAGKVNAQACTVVQKPGLEIVKTGPKEQFIGREAAYEIVVSNTGDTALQNVVVRDTAPEGTRIVSASGAQVSGNNATWQVPSLAKGEKKTFTITLTSAQAGNRCNQAVATAGRDLNASSQACTLWKGVPALLIEVVDNPDPILIGGETTFTIRVTNQGTADDNNIRIVANFAKEFDAVAAAGATTGTVTAKKVTFAVVPRLAPKQAVEWTIRAKGVEKGDHRLKVLLTSDLLTNAVTEEESTHTY